MGGGREGGVGERDQDRCINSSCLGFHVTEPVWALNGTLTQPWGYWQLLSGFSMEDSALNFTQNEDSENEHNLKVNPRKGGEV